MRDRLQQTRCSAVLYLRELKTARLHARQLRNEMAEIDRLLMWRQQAIDDYMACHMIRKLQVGTGENPLPGWLNTDVEPTLPGVL